MFKIIGRISTKKPEFMHLRTVRYFPEKIFLHKMGHYVQDNW